MSRLGSIFISYRRRDSTTESNWLAESLHTAFGAESVFIDHASIQFGEPWPDRISAAAEQATALLVVIGQSWLRLQDDSGRRLIDDPSDWVRREILVGLARAKAVIPVLLGTVSMPSKQALPAEIATLSDMQAFRIRPEFWKVDLATLLGRLENLGILRKGHGEPAAPGFRYPVCQIAPPSLSDDEIERGLKKLNRWSLAKQEERRLLERTFDFATFEDAIHFMSTASRGIAKLNHHPEWSNVFRQVNVKLTTWDRESRLTSLDFELAVVLEDLYGSYTQDASGSPV